MIKKRVLKHLDILIERYPELTDERSNIEKAYLILEDCYKNDGKLLVAGNGGSAADSEHVVSELMKSFEKTRELNDLFKKELIKINPELGNELASHLQQCLPAIALDGHAALSTAYINDCNSLLCFAQQLYGYGKEGDVFLAISTSGNSKNIIYASIVAKAKKMKIIALTGAKDSKLSELADITIRSSNTRTYMVQEHHLPIYHCLCLMLEEYFFGKN